ncbi:MAG: hypothetical protein U5J63_13080 [Fodinibius sp.]|nr:hypothetical protein [Fodinibius sp.]
MFPLELNYDVKERWNLISLPLDASDEEISNLQSKIRDGAI